MGWLKPLSMDSEKLDHIPQGGSCFHCRGSQFALGCFSLQCGFIPEKKFKSLFKGKGIPCKVCLQCGHLDIFFRPEFLREFIEQSR